MSTEYTRYFSALVDYNAGNPIDDRDLDGEFNAMTTALNRKVLCSNSAPSSPINGQTWVDTTNKYLKVYRNNEWVIITVVHVGTSAMATPQEGDLWYDSTNNILKTYNGTGWDALISLPSGSTPQDIMMIGTSTSLSRLAVGTSNQILRVSTSNTLSWSDFPVFATKGTVVHGGTISLPSGYTDDQCQILVSVKAVGAASGGDGDNLEEIQCSISTARVVTCRAYNRGGTWISGTANYLLIGIK